MGAEIICVGSELLLGQILNTNARFLALELARLGIPHYFQTVVGDNEPRIHQAIAVAAQRSQVIIFTGGLGPTADDLTHEAIASYFQVPLVENPQLWERLQQFFQARNRPLTPTQRKQCALPQGAAVLPNPWGTASGLLWEPRPGLHLLTFPGVPREMTQMWQASAVPYLTQMGWGGAVFLSETLRFWGVGEGQLAEKVADFLALPNPTVAPYAHQGEVLLRVTAAAPNEVAAMELMVPVLAELRKIGGADYFGAGETSLAQVVGAQLAAQQATIAVAEACTGGLLGELLSAPPGSSASFLGGITAYGNPAKSDLLGVDPIVAQQVGSVSREVALQMALGVQTRFGSTWGLAVTGIAGPTGGTETKPVGLVQIALVGPGVSEQREYRFGAHLGREFIRWLSAQSALDLLRRRLSAFEASDP